MAAVSILVSIFLKKTLRAILPYQYHYPLKFLTLSWRGTLAYRNQSIDMLSNSMDWFLYHNDLRHERVK